MQLQPNLVALHSAELQLHRPRAPQAYPADLSSARFPHLHQRLAPASSMLLHYEPYVLRQCRRATRISHKKRCRIARSHCRCLFLVDILMIRSATHYLPVMENSSFENTETTDVQIHLFMPSNLSVQYKTDTLALLLLCSSILQRATLIPFRHYRP